MLKKGWEIGLAVFHFAAHAMGLAMFSLPVVDSFLPPQNSALYCYSGAPVLMKPILLMICSVFCYMKQNLLLFCSNLRYMKPILLLLCFFSVI